MSKKEEQETKDEVVDTEMENSSENNEVIEENLEEDNDSVNEWEEKYTEINDKYLRLYSEFENFRKRTAKEKLDLISNAGQDMMSALLPLLDDFERAIKSNQDSADIEAVKEGVNLVFQKLNNTLTQKGLKPMLVEQGADFDLDLHEAITKIPAPDDKLKGKVVDVVEKGYYLNDKVIRYSKVVIGE